ncbi:MAG: bifunctional [glutamine synthetase] adenylyltransferase/[glutamine synthetase]-adenylyl-L-tyrosine phosphorylase [Sphingomonadales bacterium]
MLEALRGQDQAALADRLATGPLGRLSQIIADHSPFLTRLIEREAAFLAAHLDQPPQATHDAIVAEMTALPLDRPEDEMMRALRIGRRRMALVAAMADIGRLWPVDQVCRNLSSFADAAIGRAVAHSLAALMRKGDLDGGDNAEAAIPHCGYCVYALGKLGGRELNYSSDVDLIIFYDADNMAYHGNRSLQDALVRATQKWSKMLQDRTGDGYVFRVDLRLRPDPGATPVAISMNAAESYYSSIGQPWERSALIKARPIAGDLAAGQAFLEDLRPFIWRRHLDFAAIDDIHAMKRRIHEHYGLTALKLAGHNAKIGMGGIREVEFFAQIHQMIAGGKRPELRTRATLDTLAALTRAGDLAGADEALLARGYRLLRVVEHRLQMIDDAQTQSLPDDSESLEALARFMGWDSLAPFAAAYESAIRAIHQRYERLLPDTRKEDSAKIGDLAGYGFADPASAAGILERWESGRYKALATQRAQTLLRSFLPELLDAFGHADAPDHALARFDQFLSQLPAGVQLFSLFQANPSLFHLLARIMSVAPALAERLSRRPALLDSVLSADFFSRLPPPAALQAELNAKLAMARDFQDVLDDTRVWLNDRRFQIGVLMLEGLLTPLQAGDRLADLADVVLEALVPRVAAEFAKAGAGQVPGGAFATIAMGSYGARRLSYTSDLDLIFLYQYPEEVSQSDGPRPLAPSQYYSRLSQRIITALSAMTAEGRLFEVDMRLRPSGRAGVIAVSLDAFRRYQENEAWCWEHMALTKARMVATDAAMKREVETTIAAILRQPRSIERIAHDARDMRRRLSEEFGEGGRWALKTGAGGLGDIDLIVEGLTLAAAHEEPRLLQADLPRRVALLSQASTLSADQARLLREAETLLFSARAMARLLVGDAAKIEQASDASRRAFARALNYPDLDAVGNAIDIAKQQVKDLFDELYPEQEAKPS